MIIKEQENQERAEGNDTQNEDSSIIGRGQFSRVIRCRIKEESRTGQTFPSGSPQTTIPNVETTDSVETNDFSQEIALKVNPRLICFITIILEIFMMAYKIL